MEIFNWLSNNEFITDYKILEYWTKQMNLTLNSKLILLITPSFMFENI